MFELMFSQGKLIDPTLDDLDPNRSVHSQLENRLILKYDELLPDLQTNWAKNFPVEAAEEDLDIRWLYQYFYLNFLRIWNKTCWVS